MIRKLPVMALTPTRLMGRFFGAWESLPLVLTVCLSSCAPHAGVFRLTVQANVTTIVPPASKNITATSSALKIASIPRRANCGPSPHGLRIERKGAFGRSRVVVTREALEATTADELLLWTVGLEKQDCIPLHEAFRLADNIIDAVPLDVAKRSQLLKARVELTSINSLKVVSPITQAGEAVSLGEVTSILQGEGQGRLGVDVKASNVTGYEIDWYDFVPREAGRGYRIVPRSAEAHIDNRIKRLSAPSGVRFSLNPDARWYQLFMMTKLSGNDFDYVVLSARTPVELQNHGVAFGRDSGGFIRTADPTTYAVLPHGTGINAYIRVRLNDVWTDEARGSTVRQVIGKSASDLRSLLPRLTIQRLHDGNLYPVKWDRSMDKILDLPLEGGEEIKW